MTRLLLLRVIRWHTYTIQQLTNETFTSRCLHCLSIYCSSTFSLLFCTEVGTVVLRERENEQVRFVLKRTHTNQAHADKLRTLQATHRLQTDPRSPQA